MKADVEEIKEKGATLMASTKPGESSADPADEAQALRDEIEQARERLGDRSSNWPPRQT